MPIFQTSANGPDRERPHGYSFCDGKVTSVSMERTVWVLKATLAATIFWVGCFRLAM